MHQTVVTMVLDQMLHKMRRFKVNENFLLREVAGEYVLIPILCGEDDFNGIISVNTSFKFLWDQFTEPKTVDQVIEEARKIFETDQNLENVIEQDQNLEDSIAQDIWDFVNESLTYGFLLEEND